MDRVLKLDIALLHHPVINKSGEIIGSAVTNLDLHDIARAARTYGIKRYFVASPYKDQHGLIGEIIDHWQTGHGANYNPARKEALSIIRPVYSLDEIIDIVKSDNTNADPYIVVTSARKQPNTISYKELRNRLEQRKVPVLLLFGTAHGLAKEIMDRADAVLPPIVGGSDYNHLSVRSAVSIILDRLLGM